MLGASPVFGQSTSVRGIVTAAADGLPLQGVNVVLRHSDGRFYGAVTDGDGIYAITRVSAGVYQIRVSFIGFEVVEEELVLAAGDTRIINYELNDSSTELQGF